MPQTELHSADRIRKVESLIGALGPFPGSVEVTSALMIPDNVSNLVICQ